MRPIARLIAFAFAACLAAAACMGSARSGVHQMARGAVARGAGDGRVAQDLHLGDASARARPHAARSRDPGPQDPGARAGRVRADASRLRAGIEHRAARRAGQEARRRPSCDARRDRAEVRRAGQRAARDLGPRDRVRRLSAAQERHHGAGDAVLLRPPQGHVPPGIPLRAEDAGGGPHQARRHAQLLGRRHGAHAVPALRVLQARRRFRRRRQEGHLEFGARRARLRGAAARQQGLAARHALGIRGARAQGCRLHPGHSGEHAAGQRVAAARLCRRPRAPAEPSPR